MNRRGFLQRIAHLGLGAAILHSSTRLRAALPAPRLDAHTHFFSPALVARTRALIRDADIAAAVRPLDAAYVLDELDRTGVERALVLSTAYVNATDVAALGARKPSPDEYRLVRQDNDFTAAEAAKAPTRLIPFASVNPKREYALEEVKRCIELLNMRGVKLHFANSDIRLRDRGSDTIPEALKQSRAVWPMSDEEWEIVAANDGSAFLEGDR